MGTTFYTADTHFRHALVAKLRGFEDCDAHDAELVRRWNSVVRPEDTVWHLGDVALGPAGALWPYVDALNGTIHLVTGNHDRVWPYHRDAHKYHREYLGHFASVQQYARRKIAGRYVLLSHFPYAGGGDHTETERYQQYRLRDEGLWLLHGHTHSKDRATAVTLLPAMHGQTEPQWRSKQIHAGLDAWDLKPVPQHEIERLILAQEAELEALVAGAAGDELSRWRWGIRDAGAV